MQIPTLWMLENGLFQLMHFYHNISSETNTLTNQLLELHSLDMYLTCMLYIHIHTCRTLLLRKFMFLGLNPKNKEFVAEFEPVQVPLQYQIDQSLTYGTQVTHHYLGYEPEYAE